MTPLADRVARPRPPSGRRRPFRRVPARRGRAGPLALLLALTLSPGSAVADGALNALGDIFALLLLGVVGELAIPDYRYEWGAGAGDAHTTLAWPLPLSLGTVDLGERLALGFEVRGELQHRPDRGGRWAAGGRLPVYFKSGSEVGRAMEFGAPYPGLYAEGALIGGAEGSGTVVGGGLIYGNPVWGVLLSYQRLDLHDHGRRHAVGVDVHLGLPLDEFF